MSWVWCLILTISFSMWGHFNGGFLAAGVKFERSDPNLRQGLILSSSGLYSVLYTGISESNWLADTAVIYTPGATIDYYRGIDQIIAASKPDYVLLQSTILASGVRRNITTNSLHKLKHFWLESIASIHPFADQLVHKIRFRIFTDTPRDEWNAYINETISNVDVLSPQLVAEKHSFIDSILAQGVPLIITSQPLTPEGLVYKQLLEQSIDTLINPIRTGRSIYTLHYPIIVSSEHHYDPFHIRPGQSDDYLLWLQKEINSILELENDS